MHEVEVFPLCNGLPEPFPGAVADPDLGTNWEVPAADFFQELPVKRLLVRLVGRDAAARSDPEIAVGKDEVDEEDFLGGREDQRPDAFTGRSRPPLYTQGFSFAHRSPSGIPLAQNRLRLVTRVSSMSGQGSQHQKGELEAGDDQEQKQAQDVGTRLTMEENRGGVQELEQGGQA